MMEQYDLDRLALAEIGDAISDLAKIYMLSVRTQQHEIDLGRARVSKLLQRASVRVVGGAADDLLENVRGDAPRPKDATL